MEIDMSSILGGAYRRIRSELAYCLNGYSKFVLESGEFYVPPLGKEQVDLYSDKQNVHHLVRYAWAATVLKELGPQRVLDVACGCGYGTAQLASALPGAKITSIDRNKHALAYARKHYANDRTMFIREDIARLKSRLHGKSFDAVVSFDTLEHLPNQPQFVSDVSNLLEADGVFLVSAPAHRNPVNTLKNSWHIKEPTYSELEDMLTTRFEVVCQGRELPHIDVFDRINAKFEKPIYNAVWNPCFCRKPRR